MEIRLGICTHSHVSLWVSAVFIIAGMSAIDVFTPAEVFVENGTTATLPCSFKSKEVVGSEASVMWYFLAEGETGKPTPIFYHSDGKPFLGSLPQFKSRVEWVGDMNKKDASIRVIQMQFKDNGTFSCEVRNPPDINGQISVTEVRVVMKESLPQTSVAVNVGSVIGAVIGIIIIIIILISVVTCLCQLRLRGIHSCVCDVALTTRGKLYDYCRPPPEEEMPSIKAQDTSEIAEETLTAE